MPLIKSPTAPVFDLPFLSVTGLCAPSRGARETCVWRLALAPGAPAALHTVDREEIFVGLTGCARATVGDEVHELGPGDALIVPAGQPFALANPGREPFVAIALVPVGSRAAFPEGAPFAPPWTE